MRQATNGRGGASATAKITGTVLLIIARLLPYNLKYRHSADVDWCIRVMKEAERQRLPLVNAHVIVANFEEGGDTTQHHQASLWERFHVMATHYGYLQTVLLHAWFVVRSLLAVIRRVS